MYKKLSSFIIFSLLLFSCEKDNINSCDYDNEIPSGKYLTKIIEYNNKQFSRVGTVWHYSYNNLGKVSKRQQEINLGIVQAESEYFYSENILDRIEYFENKGIYHEGKIKFEYSENLLIKSIGGEFDTIKTYTYDHDNKLLVYKYSDSREFELKYDDRGNIIESIDYDSQGNKTRIEIYTHDNKVNQFYNLIPLHNAFDYMWNYKYINPNNITSWTTISRGDTTSIHEFIYKFSSHSKNYPNEMYHLYTSKYGVNGDINNIGFNKDTLDHHIFIYDIIE